MKTIFITCFHGFIGRNILSADVLTALKARDIRVVILAPKARAPSLRDEFGGEGVIVEGIDVSKEIEDRTERFFWAMATNLLATGTRRVQRRVKLAEDGNWADYIFSLFFSFLGRFRWVRSLYRGAAALAVSGQEFAPFFEKYRPGLVFATDVYALQDVKMMRSAKRRSIPVVGMVRSWDNVTSKTLLQHIPDCIAVNSSRIRKELECYGGVPKDKVFVVGVPHYDRYLAGGHHSRSSFCKAFGLDEKKKIILFATPSDRYLKGNPITPIALEALKGMKDVQVFVRLPVVGKAELDNYRPPPNVVFDDPGSYPDFTVAHVSREADQHLADCLAVCDVVITWASTMIVDAAVFGKPVILVGFDATPRPYHQSILRFYDYEHHRPVLKYKAARLVKSPKELLEWTERYLSNPRLDEQGRRRIVEEFCGPTDGKAGERLGNFILERLKYENQG
ncbi:MAG: CDP-glycerol glycerophosphotransferase family protein [Candidatus Sungbacteria bacterium]|nr:CDP-glycerol glycerophosphotransferase family protein [Candidatus Sungbacteria bacterium]